MSATVNDLQDLSAISWPLRTPRLTIRPSRPEDADALFQYRSLPDVAEWLPVLPTDRAEWAERFAAPERLACTLIAEVDGEVVGDLYLQLRDGWAQAEVKEQARNSDAALGWAIAPAHTGRGYATEAAAELVRACFVDLGVRRVVAEAYADNHASRRIMDKLGMRQEQHTVKESLHRTRGWLDGVSYALLAEEWRALTR
ncbi:GNAT family N-acetyltransferase [Nocardioides sp. GCM10027113]|uniref:GNAT family N-acetyltransferase n=1 Tax=unclassified Nocardioides TaxID=2615069 RepID=UPI0036202C38